MTRPSNTRLTPPFEAREVNFALTQRENDLDAMTHIIDAADTAAKERAEATSVRLNPIVNGLRSVLRQGLHATVDYDSMFTLPFPRNIRSSNRAIRRQRLDRLKDRGIYRSSVYGYYNGDPGQVVYIGKQFGDMETAVNGELAFKIGEDLKIGYNVLYDVSSCKEPRIVKAVSQDQVDSMVQYVDSLAQNMEWVTGACEQDVIKSYLEWFPGDIRDQINVNPAYGDSSRWHQMHKDHIASYHAAVAAATSRS